MKKIIAAALSIIIICGITAGCASKPAGGGGNGETSVDFKETRSISVVSREDGSGTRGAFIELFGIEEKDGSGNKKDKTTKEAVIANKTDVMMTNIASDTYAIGYISLGSLNSTVKALKIDGVVPSAENIKNGTYKISRPFNIATKGNLSDVAKDFINFIMAKEGQAVIAKNYVPVNESAEPYGGAKPNGKVTISGSSSVSPVMEQLKEAYLEINPNAVIEVQMSDSTTGINDAIKGSCDIGMASRPLKDSEKESLTPLAIAYDGIAVIVSLKNPLEELSSEQVKKIFTGEYVSWSDLK